MNYCKIKQCDIADGLGVRVSLFVSGCTNHCKGCFQPETWDFNYGWEFDKSTEDTVIRSLKQNYVNGLTLLGGDPFEPKNQYPLYQFLLRVKKEVPDKDIWSYTGFRFEDILDPTAYPHTSCSDEYMNLIDVLVDGPYEEELRSPALKFRGSSNQRIIDVKKSIESNQIILVPIIDREYNPSL